MTEPPSLFPPTYRLVGLCLLVGAVGAGVGVAFQWLVEVANGLLLGTVAGVRLPEAGSLSPTWEVPSGSSRWWLPVVTTLGGLISGVLVYRFAPEAAGHGTDAAIGAYHGGGEVRGRAPLVKALASAAILGSAGVAGREGPAAQISSGVGAALARWLGVRGQERRILLLASMAAGLAAIFRAPLGMAIFAVEILYSGMVFESEALIYTVLAAVTAYALHGLVVGWEPVFEIPQLSFERPVELIGFALLGVAAGLVAAALPLVFEAFRRGFRRLPGPDLLKPAIGGLALGLLAVAFPQVAGTGYGFVELAMAGSLSIGTMAALLVLKAPAMSLTIASGGSGGIFGPTVVIGGMLGGVVGYGLVAAAPALVEQPAAYVVVGMAAVFAAAARTPISTLIMTAEMTGGYALIVPTMLANVLAFVVQRQLTARSRHPTLYHSQVETREDSPVHRGVFVRRALQALEAGEVDPAEIPLPRLVKLLQYGEALHVGHGSGRLVSIQVAAGSALAGSTVAESVGPLGGAAVVAVLRGDEMLVPRGPTRFRAGDQVILLAIPEASEQARLLAAGGEPHAPRHGSETESTDPSRRPAS